MKEKIGGRGADEEDDDDAFDPNSGETMAGMAKEEFRKLFDAENGEDDLQLDGKYKKLFEMDFMKKASEQQKLRAREEAQQVLKEIEAFEAGDHGSGDDNALLSAKSASAAEKKAAREKVGTMFSQNAGSGFQLNLSKQALQAASQVPTSTIEPAILVSTTVEPPKKSKPKKGATVIESQLEPTGELSNPWLEVSAVSGNSTGKKRGAKQLGVKAKSEELNDLQVLVAMPEGQQKDLKSKSTPKDVSTTETSVKSSVDTEKKVLSNKTQDELVQMAFAAPDFEADFLSHKQQDIDRELGFDEKKLKILKDGESLTVVFDAFAL
jgi:U3 small nucleolar RNA-associated protein 14